MAKNALIIDYNYCTGCHSCEVACRKEKELTGDEYGIKVTEQGPIKWNGKWMYDFVPIPSSLCNSCEELTDKGLKPACVHHCLGDCMFSVPPEEAGALMVERGGSKIVCFMP